MSESNAAGQGAQRWNDPAHESARQAQHEVLIDLLGAYVDGELPAETASQLDAHLVGCARCRREVQLQHSLQRHLAAVSVEPAAPAFRDRLLATIAQTPLPAEVPAPLVARTGRRMPRTVTVVVALVLLAVAGWAVSRTVGHPAATTTASQLAVPARTVPLLAEVAADYARVAAADLPGPARDLDAVRAATGLRVEPLANPDLRLLGVWTTTLEGETVAVLAYRWEDRTVVQYIVPDQLFFRHPALRAAAAAHHAVTAQDGAIGLVAWPVTAAGSVLVGDGNPQRLVGALVP